MTGQEHPEGTSPFDKLGDGMHRRARAVGTLLVDAFHYVGLFAIGATTVWAALATFLDLVLKKHHASVEDLLLLFIYLEIGAMVGIYFKTNHMPVRFLLYVAITAATRHMIGIVNHSAHPGLDLLIMPGSILVLAMALLAVRFASFNYPSGPVRPVSFKTDLDR
jgi:phosphate starvation-inducible membrane PsiE